MKQIWDYGLF
jgi:hypothetical protein